MFMEESIDKENTHLKILHVEDDSDDRLFFKEALTDLKISHSLYQVPSCKCLMDKLADGEQFDLIFLDINMPVTDGKQCLKIIKATELYKDTPVIIFTVSKRDQDVEEVYKSGAHFHIVKPYSRKNFLASLKIIFAINWKVKQAAPQRDNFFIDYTLGSSTIHNSENFPL
jgi:CheY-like chemotaxis protein